jgi:hypothetical protein
MEKEGSEDESDEEDDDQGIDQEIDALPLQYSMVPSS